MIKGDGLCLRTVQERDLDALYTRINDLASRGEEVNPITLFPEPVFKREFKDTGFWAEDRGRLLLCDNEDRVLGMIWFFKTAPFIDGYEIGYQIFDVSTRNKGLMTEALSMLTGYLFRSKKINRLQLSIVPANTASRRVAQKNGYRHEGTLRGAIFLDHKNNDLETWAILRHEFENKETE